MKSVDRNSTVTDMDTFAWMLGKFREYMVFNKNIRELPKTRVKDVSYSDSTRVTYDCEDINAMKITYKKEPSAVIRKQRLDDVNIKCAP